MTNFKIMIEREGSRLRITLSGEFDEICSSLIREILRQNQTGVNLVSIDIKDLVNSDKHALLESHFLEWEKALFPLCEN